MLIWVIRKVSVIITLMTQVHAFLTLQLQIHYVYISFKESWPMELPWRPKHSGPVVSLPPRPRELPRQPKHSGPVVSLPPRPRELPRRPKHSGPVVSLFPRPRELPRNFLVLLANNRCWYILVRSPLVDAWDGIFDLSNKRMHLGKYMFFFLISFYLTFDCII